MNSPRLQVVSRPRHAHQRHTPDLPDLFNRLGCTTIDQLPFASGDVTAGSESELQAVVVGAASNVDLPQTIEHSRFFANMVKRAQAGETPENRWKPYALSSKIAVSKCGKTAGCVLIAPG